MGKEKGKGGPPKGGPGRGPPKGGPGKGPGKGPGIHYMVVRKKPQGQIALAAPRYQPGKIDHSKIVGLISANRGQNVNHVISNRKNPPMKLNVVPPGGYGAKKNPMLK